MKPTRFRTSPAALVAVFSVLLGFLVATAPAPAAAAPTCDRPAVIASAMAALGEHSTPFAMVPLDQVKSLRSDAIAFTRDSGIVFASNITCRYLPAIVAHELGHTWEARKYGSMSRAIQAYGDHFETIADCVALTTGWDFYQPYLNARGYACTDYEHRAALGLRAMAR